jgi:hypothetical protein
MTLSEALGRTACKFPALEALVVRHQKLRLTCREFDERLRARLAGLRLWVLRSRIA